MCPRWRKSEWSLRSKPGRNGTRPPDHSGRREAARAQVTGQVASSLAKGTARQHHVGSSARRHNAGTRPRRDRRPRSPNMPDQCTRGCGRRSCPIRRGVSIAGSDSFPGSRRSRSQSTATDGQDEEHDTASWGRDRAFGTPYVDGPCPDRWSDGTIVVELLSSSISRPRSSPWYPAGVARVERARRPRRARAARWRTARSSRATLPTATSVRSAGGRGFDADVSHQHDGRPTWGAPFSSVELANPVR
jgi:hypothetical protein